MVSSLPLSEGMEEKELDFLSNAYEQGRDALINEHQFTSSHLGDVVSVMVTSLFDFYRAGERDVEKLVRHAVARGLEDARKRRKA